MFVKICGITNIDDAVASLEAGADAIGFVMAESSRQVTNQEAKKICYSLPDTIKKVGVFEDQSIEDVIQISNYVGFDTVQLHGYTYEDAVKLSEFWKVIVALPYHHKDLAQFESNKSFTLLIDSHTPGSGKTFDWQALPELEDEFILAGGLSPDNVAEAVEKLNPWGADVSTGVSKTVRVKDHKKIKDFVVNANAL